MNTVGIVQARMGSSRLPGKVLMEVGGKPLILHMLDRMSRAQTLDQLWLATSDQPADTPLAEAVESAGYNVFRGSENDVLDRFYQVAQEAKAEAVVRLTGDCPLHDPAVIDALVSGFRGSGCAYGANVFPPTFPDGLDAEVFTFDALEHAARHATGAAEREHVTPAIHRQGDAQPPRIFNLRAPADFGHLRWTLDYPEDLELIKQVMEGLPEGFSWLDVVALQTKRPALLQLNAMYRRS
jgi:glutamate-1-semialdehyde 2,1-aminomutase